MVCGIDVGAGIVWMSVEFTLKSVDQLLRTKFKAILLPGLMPATSAIETVELSGIGSALSTNP